MTLVLETKQNSRVHLDKFICGCECCVLHVQHGHTTLEVSVFLEMVWTPKFSRLLQNLAMYLVQHAALLWDALWATDLVGIWDVLRLAPKKKST